MALAVALGAPAAASAQDFGFTYLEGGLFGGFVNGVETSGTFTDSSRTADLESDAGDGAYIVGSWQFWDNLHVFGEYAKTSQELEVTDGAATVSGDYDLLRWRIGVGYAYPLSNTLGLYGRLSFDNAEVKNAKAPGFNFEGKAERDGLGGEVGVTWAATPAIHLQGHLRYTPAGKLKKNGADDMDADVLVGLNGRWYFRPDIALVGGYEFGKITTLNLGVRFSF